MIFFLSTGANGRFTGEAPVETIIFSVSTKLVSPLESVTSITADGQETYTVETIVPNYPPGEYCLLVYLDYGQDVPEFDLENNYCIIKFRITDEADPGIKRDLIDIWYFYEERGLKTKKEN